MPVPAADTVVVAGDTTNRGARDSLLPLRAPADSLLYDVLYDDPLTEIDSIATDTLKPKQRKEKKAFLEDPISGRNRDSLVYNLREKTVYIYKEGDVDYQEMNLKADYMRIRMGTKEIHAYGITDSLGKKTRPEFTEGGTVYTMDTINYNIDTKKAKIKGVATREGEGFLIGKDIKKMEDNTINIAHGQYTTCDHIDHPHFYLEMSKAKMIPGKKIIVGPSWLVMEDVPIYFPLIPFGFFPIMQERGSGFIVPTYGEEASRGFFLRDGGYYFAFNDYIDVEVLGGYYSLGSWSVSAASRYIKRYRYTGDLSFAYDKVVSGEVGDLNYSNSYNYRLVWNHRQDSKFRPGTTFTANVNFSSSGYDQRASADPRDYVNTQTSSSVTYSKNWTGTPMSFNTSITVTQRVSDSTYNFTLPINFSASRITPFKRRNAVGRQRWYEKITTSYTGSFANNVTVKEKDLFTPQMAKDLNSTITHTIPLQTSLTLFNYINVTPGANYTENWSFRSFQQEWDPATKAQMITDTTYGFYRTFNYGFNVSATTKIYGIYQFKNKKSKLQAVRHMITPLVGMSFTPNFKDPSYGFWKPIQTDSTGTIGYYSPYTNAPGGNKSASMNFSLSQNLEAKVLSDRDTSGMRKIRIIDDFTVSGSYNFVADSINFSPLRLSLRTKIVEGFDLNLNATLDLYEVDQYARPINRFYLQDGKLGRISNASWSFNYSFRSSQSNREAINDMSGANSPDAQANLFNDPSMQNMDPAMRRMMMTQLYYDFEIPWNFGFSYSFNYSDNGIRKNIMQTFNLNGSVNLTPKWGITFGGGFDFKAKKPTFSPITITRDLHCWQMNLMWVPSGPAKMWSFNIGVKSALLQDLKWDKQSSRYDSLLDQ